MWKAFGICHKTLVLSGLIAVSSASFAGGSPSVPKVNPISPPKSTGAPVTMPLPKNSLNNTNPAVPPSQILQKNVVPAVIHQPVTSVKPASSVSSQPPKQIAVNTASNNEWHAPMSPSPSSKPASLSSTFVSPSKVFENQIKSGDFKVVPAVPAKQSNPTVVSQPVISAASKPNTSFLNGGADQAWTVKSIVSDTGAYAKGIKEGGVQAAGNLIQGAKNSYDTVRSAVSDPSSAKTKIVQSFSEAKDGAKFAASHPSVVVQDVSNNIKSNYNSIAEQVTKSPSDAGKMVGRSTFNVGTTIVTDGVVKSGGLSAVKNEANLVDSAKNLNKIDLSSHISNGSIEKNPIIATKPQIKSGSAGGETAGKVFPKTVKDAAKQENPKATCVYCRMDGTAVQVDHAIPKANGGNATLSNAQLTCPHCNASKGAKSFPSSPPPGYRGKWPPSHW